MPSDRPSTAIWNEMADLIGCDIPSIKAVFEVEAAGKFYNADGSLPRRFEPHQFPRTHWGKLRYTVAKNQAPWRASLKIRTSERRRMFSVAENINRESAYDASSWGAPQIMGFNAETSGHDSAVNMVDAFEQSADEQIRAFAAFCIENNLDGHIRSQNWLAFASGYNGNGQAHVYAAKIESAYRRQSGGRRSSPILRMGTNSAAVGDMQQQLVSLGYDVAVDGAFGIGTKRVVKEFQAANGLVVDGIAGAVTLRKLAELQETETESTIVQAPVQERATTIADLRIDTIVKQGLPILGSGGAVGLLSNVNDTSQTIIIGGVVVGVLLIAALYFLKKRI